MSGVLVRGQRGVALLIALAALVLTLSGLAAGMAALRGARQEAWTAAVDARLLAGLRQGEHLAAAWLAASADRIVLPPDGGGILLVDDRIVLPDGEGRLTVTIWDGLAGVPACLAQRGAALRQALPAALAPLEVPAIPAVRAEASAHLVDVLALPEDVPRFPPGHRGAGRVWRVPGTPAGWSDAPAAQAADLSLATAISFHSDGRINLNTAPAPLLRAAYTSLGLGGFDEVLTRRRAGTASPPPPDRPVGGLRLVAQSDRWEARITAAWQGIARSWWVVFAGATPAFSMVERHDIRE